ncbi:EKC/KEOPS complex subunit GON7 [Cyberlindnera fabianii]|nr:EKC/KEOPS complex subunit GON7 [Cyberlindnera fabianii]
MSSPSATYTSPSSTQEFTTSSIPPAELTTRGSTTGPSDFVLSKGAVDKDAPSEHKDTYLGVLRAQVTNLQDQINVYLTERMRIQKEEEKESEMEKKLLDGGDDDSDEEETKK